MSGGSLTPFSSCHMTPGGNPCEGNGKYWTQHGDRCIAKCYVNPAFAGVQSALFSHRTRSQSPVGMHPELCR